MKQALIQGMLYARMAIYSLRGKPMKAQKLFVRGEHISAIAAMSMNGLKIV